MLILYHKYGKVHILKIYTAANKYKKYELREIS